MKNTCGWKVHGFIITNKWIGDLSFKYLIILYHVIRNKTSGWGIFLQVENTPAQLAQVKVELCLYPIVE